MFAMKLNKSEIEVLELLCSNEYPMRELAEKWGRKQPFVSRVVKQLDEKAMIQVKRNGVQKIVSLFSFGSAQSFKRLYETRKGLSEWLSGACLDVLIVLSTQDRDLKELERESDYSRPMIYKALKKLYAAGAIAKERGVIRVSDEEVKQFAIAFAQDVTARKMIGSASGQTLGKAWGKRLLIVNRYGQLSKEFELTGLNRLARDYGLEGILTDRQAYYQYLGKKKKELGIEDYFIHALALTKNFQGEDKPLLAVFLKGHKMNPLKLRELAKEFGVEAELRELQSAVGYYDRLGG